MLKLKAEKLNVGFDPYAYVRTVVMKSLLFRREDYQKMLKMSFSEIAKFLQESHYKKDIDALATSHSGADLLEQALNRNLAASSEKLIEISSDELRILIEEYSRRRDVEDFKTVIRGKYTNTDEKSIFNSITGAGVMSKDYFLSLAKKDSVEQIVTLARVFDAAEVKRTLRQFGETKSISVIENALDRKYYKNLLRFADKISKSGELFREFILKEVEILNLLTLLRLKKAKIEGGDFLILSGNYLRDQRVLELAKVENIDELSKALSKTEYGNIFKDGLEEYKKTGSLIKLETDLYKFLLKRSIRMLHVNILSVDVILGYMFAKEIEVRNLRIIVKGKQLSLPEQFIESQLIME